MHHAIDNSLYFIKTNYYLFLTVITWPSIFPWKISKNFVAFNKNIMTYFCIDLIFLVMHYLLFPIANEILQNILLIHKEGGFIWNFCSS